MKKYQLGYRKDKYFFFYFKYLIVLRLEIKIK